MPDDWLTDAGNAPASDDNTGGPVGRVTPSQGAPTNPGAGQGPDRRFYSASNGTVAVVGWENPLDHGQGYGFRIRVQGDDGQTYTYGHTDPASSQVQVGDRVTQGQYLGDYADPTNGHSDGPHTHLEVRDPSRPLQPEYNDYIKKSRSMGALVDPTPYIGIVMPNAVISSRFKMRTLNGKREFHPGLDIKRSGS
jgi:murein DD-endopeptidase MepM/ murein hydrolase activator NlpD